MARLYTDEDFSYPVIQRLRQLSHDIFTAYEAGQADQGIKDEAVLAFAIAAGRAVLTFNRRHFIRLHTEVSSHEGIIVCTRDDDVSALANRIINSSRVFRPFRISCYGSTVLPVRNRFEYFDDTASVPASLSLCCPRSDTRPRPQEVGAPAA